MEYQFDIITKTEKYIALLKQAMDADLIRDICDEKYSNLSDEDINAMNKEDYIKVVQKSPCWLTLRGKSWGTASAVGKYIYLGPHTFPKKAEVIQAWTDKLRKVPFSASNTAKGHMKWGVVNELTALMHFALEEKVGVVQVGSIKVCLSQIIKLGQLCFKDKWISIFHKDIEEKYLLVSPDGIVGEPDWNASDCYTNLKGMLEIKCISPFYHIETEEGQLKWIPDLNKRQWFTAKEIPFVYIVQQSLQAISGIIKYKMTSKSIMWFIRWSPMGFSVFKFNFMPLVRLGTLIANLYFSLCDRYETPEIVQTSFGYTPDEQKIFDMMMVCYSDLLENAVHKYVPLDCYPEFMSYYSDTKDARFVAPL